MNVGQVGMEAEGRQDEEANGNDLPSHHEPGNT